MAQTVQRHLSGEPGSLQEIDLYEFGPCRIDLARHLVTRGGRVLSLAPKTFELLLILVRSGGRVLTRQELVAALWPDTFVEEANLSFQISILRKALGGSSGSAAAETEGVEPWIETVPKVGYRFTAEVTAMSSREPRVPAATPFPVAVSAQAVTDDRAVYGSRQRLNWRWISVAAIAGSLGAGMYATLVRDTAVARPIEYGGASPLTAYPGIEGHPSLSPDGSMVAFNWGGPTRGHPDIYVKLVGQGEPVQVTSDPAPDLAPAWSPDGKRLTFLRARGGSAVSELFVIPALGGTERRVASLEVFGGHAEHPGTTYLSWTPDGKWVALGGVVDGVSGIWLVEVDGAERRRLTDPPSRHSDRSPVVSGDGRRVAFSRSRPYAPSALFVLPLSPDLHAAGTLVQVVDPAPLSIIAAAWGPGDGSLVFSTGGNMGSSRLQRVALRPDGLGATGPPEPLPFGEQATGLDMAPSGRLVYASRFRDTGFWTLDLTQPDTGLRDSNLLASTHDEHSPNFSPDGTRLVFVSTRSGAEEVWVANADGSQPRQMTSMGGPTCANAQWSPDGQRIAFSSTKAGSFDLYLLDPATASVDRLTSAPGTEDHPRWSRDGRWIYFKGPGQTAPTEIWKMPASGGTTVQVTTGGGAIAEESHDGRLLFFTRVNDARASLWRMPATGGEATQVATKVFGTLNFAVGRTAVYLVANTFEGNTPNGHAIDRVDIATGMRTTIARFPKPAWFGLALSPDERTLVATAIAASGADLMVAEPVR